MLSWRSGDSPTWPLHDSIMGVVLAATRTAFFEENEAEIRKRSEVKPQTFTREPLSSLHVTREPLSSLHAWSLSRGSRVKDVCIGGRKRGTRFFFCQRRSRARTKRCLVRRTRRFYMDALTIFILGSINLLHRRIFISNI